MASQETETSKDRPLIAWGVAMVLRWCCDGVAMVLYVLSRVAMVLYVLSRIAMVLYVLSLVVVITLTFMCGVMLFAGFSLIFFRCLLLGLCSFVVIINH